MGDGADSVSDGQPGPVGWGPPEPTYQHSNFEPQYVPQPQPRQQAPQQFAQPQYPTPHAPPRARRTRRSSKVETRLRMVQCFEELLSTPVFDDPNDPYAAAVQEEIATFAQRRIDELFGEPGAKVEASGFTPEEAAALKVLAQKMMAPDEEAEAPAPVAPAPPPPPPPPAPVRGPRGCVNPACQFPPHDTVAFACSNVPPQRPQQPVQAPQPPPVPEEPDEGPRVVQRPSAAQRAALDAARAQRAAAPPPPPQPVYQQPPPQEVQQPSRMARRGKRGQTQSVVAPGPPPKALAPPPKRYAMPQGAQMTMVTGQKAEEAIASGGTVLSETFVRAPHR